jgi:hypothetical protein
MGGAFGLVRGVPEREPEPERKADASSPSAYNKKDEVPIHALLLSLSPSSPSTQPQLNIGTVPSHSSCRRYHETPPALLP